VCSFGQTSNLRQKKVAAFAVITIDSLAIIPNSFTVAGVDSSCWRFDYRTKELHWIKDCGNDSVFIRYRVYDAVSIRYRSTLYDSALNKLRVAQVGSKKVKDIFHSNNNITYSGSFARSVSVGNTQSASFNSNLNLQLSGYIADSIQIIANLSDNNLQLQPDGSTQQLNEFDRVSLQFKKNDRSVSLGDIDLQADRLRYLKFNKRVQGISFHQNSTVNDIKFSAGLAKGKFTRNSFVGIEGNQGPYRLSTPNRELFFIVSAGTEKVFLNGDALQRGEENDYTINYNTAEIFFSSKRMITKDSRIQVEFEYADQYYLNTLIYAEQKTRLSSKLSLHWGVYTSADSKNSSLANALTSEQKQFLSESNSDETQVFYNRTSLTDVAKAGYIRVDTFHNGMIDSIYIYSTEAGKLKYAVPFVEVGSGNGNYVSVTGSTIEKIYKWIEPVNGVRQGNYEPGEFLVTPKNHKVITASMQFDIDSTCTILIDAAGSTFNTNSFNNNNFKNGYAGKMSISKSAFLSRKNNLRLSAGGSYERISDKFQAPERIYDAEFEREWGLPVLSASTAQTLSTVNFQVVKDATDKLSYDLKKYTRSNYSGVQHAIHFGSNHRTWKAKNDFRYTQFKTLTDRGLYVKINSEIQKDIQLFKKTSLGISYESERSVSKNLIDSLTSASFANETYGVFIKSDREKKNQWSMQFSKRITQMAYNGKLLPADESLNYDLSASLVKSKNHQLRFNIIYRDLQVHNKQLTNNNSDKNLLGRTAYSMNIFKGSIKYDLLYELGSAQEQKRNVSFFEVPGGRGTHTWLDNNHDSIQQLNEFVSARFSDQATFLRLHTPTNEFISANFSNFSYSLTINPASFINKEKSFWKKVLFQSSAQIQKKTTGEKSAYNSFSKNVSDTGLIQLNYALANVFSINKFGSKWSFDISNKKTNSKSLLNYGLESRESNAWCFNGRMNINPVYSFEYIQRFSSTILRTDAFKDYNYSIRTVEFEPRITYNTQDRLRFTGGYQYVLKENKIEYGGEAASFNNVYAEMKWSLPRNSSITARVNYEKISFTRQRNSSVSYIILNGLMPGNNFLWNLDISKRIFNSMELTLQYEGRKPALSKTVNIGRLAIRAVL
jgi:hypothetical protein